MPMPPSVTRLSKDGITFVSNVDRTQYTIKELSRRALYDVAKFIRREVIKEIRTLPGMKRGKRPPRGIHYWVRSKETDLQIGFGHSKRGLSGDTWYLIQQELGSRRQPKRSILRNVVYNNIDKIRLIEGQYLSYINDENKALGFINDKTYESSDNEE
ncbi:MAG: hypothetical protein RIN55_05585 [Tissierellaceae bacterium]|nr:hypothetical protein [Tissierellaceae bacterium]